MNTERFVEPFRLHRSCHRRRRKTARSTSQCTFEHTDSGLGNLIGTQTHKCRQQHPRRQRQPHEMCVSCFASPSTLHVVCTFRVDQHRRLFVSAYGCVKSVLWVVENVVRCRTKPARANVLGWGVRNGADTKMPQKTESSRTQIRMRSRFFRRSFDRMTDPLPHFYGFHVLLIRV